ncbi:MAG TPA: alpha/beta fold hydrolase [Patescibacteria group bacterium]|nr:alpha/beta fold hydrolase [Patescibacteria group bacterium]
MPPQPHVLVLHGLGMHSLAMLGLERHLAAEGWIVHNLSYPSLNKGFEEIVAEHVAPAAAAIDAPQFDIVGHSMGGLLARLYALRHGASRIHRSVMLGTPNHGSQVADVLGGYKAFQWLTGAVGQGLATSAQGIHAALPPLDFDCGVIAGDSGILNIATTHLADIPRPNDGVVSVESTRVAGMKAHITVSAEHTQMIFSPIVWALTVKFLKTGAF